MDQTFDFERARQILENGGLIYRTSWPPGTLLVQQGGYEIPIDKWSDRTPLTKRVLQSLGITESFKINAHNDMLTSNKVLQPGYVFTRDDVSATNWAQYEIPIEDIPSQPLIDDIVNIKTKEGIPIGAQAQLEARAAEEKNKETIQTEQNQQP